jgi:hypothetical protein
MFYTHDFVHGVRIAEMTRALKDGHFPVRWSSNFAYGYGMPLFEFYAPLPFYVGALFYLSGFSLIISSKLLFLLPNVLTALGAYLLGKRISGVRGGLVAAALITLAPYRGMNLFIRGAISETWGIMALVWLLYATVLTVKKNVYGPIILVVSLVTLYLSHNLTVIIGLPFVGLWTIVWIWLEHKKSNHPWLFSWQRVRKDIFLFGCYYLLSVGIASFYLLPLFIEKDFTKVENATTGGYFDYHLHFLYIRQFFRPEWGYGGSEWGPDDKLPFFLGYAQYFGLCIGVLGTALAGWKVWYHKERKEDLSFWLLLVALCSLGVSLFMTLAKSASIWEALSFMKYIQFPWRFYAAAGIYIGIVAALGIQLVSKRWTLGLTVILVAVALAGNGQYFKPEKYLEDPHLLYYDDPLRVQCHMSGILPDYIPKTLADTSTPPRQLLRCGAVDCQELLVVRDSTQYKEFDFVLPQTATVVASIADFPGWKLQVNGQDRDITTDSQGLISTELPAGKYNLKIWFGATALRKLADMISLASSTICITWIIWTVQVTKKKI